MTTAKAMSGEIPECIGRKKCREYGPNNENRISCRFYIGCINAFILKRLERGRAPHQIREELVDEVWTGVSDYIALMRIATVTVENGFRFGRKKVDRAIKESDICNDPDPNFEKREIRKAFGVHGCVRASLENCQVGRKNEPRINADEKIESGPGLTMPRPVSAASAHIDPVFCSEAK